MTRQATEDEIRDKYFLPRRDEAAVLAKRGAFLEGIKRLVEYWQRERRPTVDERLAGLAFSILAMIDGGSGVDGFKGAEILVEGDVINRGVELHEIMHRAEPGPEPSPSPLGERLVALIRDLCAGKGSPTLQIAWDPLDLRLRFTLRAESPEGTRRVAYSTVSMDLPETLGHRPDSLADARLRRAHDSLMRILESATGAEVAPE